MIRIGVFGARRGRTMMEAISKHPDCELVAICDAYAPKLEECRAFADEAGCRVTCYEDFDRFMDHDMDAVVVANYATEHAPYAIRLLESGRHVASEVVACQTMAEAVALVEAVERSGRVYTYLENFCYFPGTLEIRRLYRRGVLGEFLYGEGEYVHDCEPIWPDITYGCAEHWRNWVPSTFYCTHSIGPIVTITGARPTRISAYETPNVNNRRFGRLGSDGSMIACQMSNGAVARFLPWCGFKRTPESVWYAVYGSKGMAETDRWTGFGRLHVYLEAREEKVEYDPGFPFESVLSRTVTGHGGADAFAMQFFIDSILDRPGKEYAIDVYEALDMSMPGILGYRSICEGNAPIDVPDMRDGSFRDLYRHDNWCADPKQVGPGQPKWPSSFGPVYVDDSVYEETARRLKALVGQDIH